MAEKKPNNVYLTTNMETGQKRLVRAVGVIAARNHAADQLFGVRRLSTGELLDIVASSGLPIETAGESAQKGDPDAEEGQDAPTGEDDGGTDGVEV